MAPVLALQEVVRRHHVENIETILDELETQGFVTIPAALHPDQVEDIRLHINAAREKGWEEGLNAVGNMWFDSLLDREPETFGPLVGQEGIRPVLEGMMGPQTQLRSFRAHINPGPYHQEWHLDFYGYWEEKRRADQYRLTVPPIGVNTTFYFQDNGPGIAHLKFIKHGHTFEPEHLYPMDRQKFEAWCEAQEHVIIYPKAGDCVVFLSHIPHQGVKENDSVERSNVVCHYQMTPMHEGAWFVSRARGWQGTFPFADNRRGENTKKSA